MLGAGNYLCRFRMAYSTTTPKTAPMAAPVRVLRVVGHGTPLSQCIRTLAQPIAPPTIAPMVPPVTPCGRPECDADFKCVPTRGTAENPSRAGIGSSRRATSEIFRPATSDRTLSCPERLLASAAPVLNNPRVMKHKNKDNLMDLLVMHDVVMQKCSKPFLIRSDTLAGFPSSSQNQFAEGTAPIYGR